MHDYTVIGDITSQMEKVCDKIRSVSNGIATVKNVEKGLCEVYEQLLLDEVKHAQILVLELTKAVTEDYETESNNIPFAEKLPTGEIVTEQNASPVEETKAIVVDVPTGETQEV